MIFWLLTILFTIFIYFLNKTIIALKEDDNYKKYLYISSFVIYICSINFEYFKFNIKFNIMLMKEIKEWLIWLFLFCEFVLERAFNKKIICGQ